MRKYANSTDIKDQNSRLILDLLRRRSRSRADLAHATGLTRQSVSQIVDRLLGDEFLVELGPQEGGVGRNPILLDLNRTGRYMVGVNLTRIHAQVGIVDLHGNPVCCEELPTADMPAGKCIELISESILNQIKENGIPRERLSGIGVSAPGPLDYRTGVICNPPGFRGWHGVPIADELSGSTELPVQVENIADAMALEEMYFGCCQDVSSFMVVTVDEEIGAGIVIGGTLHRGVGGFGGEIGHISICFDGPDCECGNRGCLSRYASIPELLAGTSFAGWRDVVEQAVHNPQAREVLAREAGYLTSAIVSAVNLLDLELVLMGGDLAYQPNALLEEMNAMLRQRIITPARSQDTIVCPIRSTGSVRTATMPLFQEFFSGNRI